MNYLFQVPTYIFIFIAALFISHYPFQEVTWIYELFKATGLGLGEISPSAVLFEVKLGNNLIQAPLDYGFLLVAGFLGTLEYKRKTTSLNAFISVVLMGMGIFAMIYFPSLFNVFWLTACVIAAIDVLLDFINLLMAPQKRPA